MSDIHVAHFTSTEQRLIDEARARRARIAARAVPDDGIDLRRKKTPKNVGIILPQKAPEIPQQPEKPPQLSTQDLMLRISELEAEIAGLRGDRQFVEAALQTPTINAVQRKVCEFYRISIIDMMSHRQTTDVTFPRQVAMYLCRRITDKGYPQIGRKFKRDHTTVLHAVRKIEGLINTDPALAARLDAIAQAVMSEVD